ncbi:tRNA 2-thiouridine(34) synthase MnmA [Ruminococcaceae bacterium OttesenSCG-928-I18]|nr:tRNA 2-thiouridine(34) synthase MnmA [Ruminococcaceae bacterium OttesenSCG-928-I18]
MPIPPSANVPPVADPNHVLVALSGGVDSAVAVRILQQQGFLVEGAVISFSPAHQKAVEAAGRAAEELGIHLEILHCEALFEKKIIEPFCKTYAEGRTPSPCVLCNPEVKFRVLQEEADKRGIHWIASGHYARCEPWRGGYAIARAASAARDQSYMLYRLPQRVLERLCLPLGDFKKEEIRRMATENKLSCADAPDSQEICFIPQGDYTSFIENRGITGKQGRLFGPDGQDLGAHRGVIHYTVGQRKGLGVALGEPVFVRSIEKNGDIYLARTGGEYAEGIGIADTVFTGGAPVKAGARYEVKIRSAAKAVPCRILAAKEGRVEIGFLSPQRAAAPGQHAVLYEGEYIVGGGEIDTVF